MAWIGSPSRHVHGKLLSRTYVSMMGDQLGRVTMYKKDSCPYCAKSKVLLEEKYGLKVTYVDIEEPDR